MKSFMIKFLRIASWLVIILNTIGIGVMYYSADRMLSATPFGAKHAMQQVFNNWKSDPFNFGNSDVMYVNMTILLYLIPILILIFVRNKRTVK